jgi:hypothetical protein
MKLSQELQKKLSQVYEPSSMISIRFKGNDVSFKTDEEGNPVVLFIGKKNSEGNIKGERYTRTFKRDDTGKVFKDHWDLKGRAT